MNLHNLPDADLRDFLAMLEHLGTLPDDAPPISPATRARFQSVIAKMDWTPRAPGHDEQLCRRCHCQPADKDGLCTDCYRLADSL